MGGTSHTPGPWDYVPSTEHHGPYVTSQFGSMICDLYVMSQPGMFSTANGGPSKPLPFMHEMADPNARLIAAAPELKEAAEIARSALEWFTSNRGADPSGMGLNALNHLDRALSKSEGR